MALVALKVLVLPAFTHTHKYTYTERISTIMSRPIKSLDNSKVKAWLTYQEIYLSEQSGEITVKSLSATYPRLTDILVGSISLIEDSSHERGISPHKVLTALTRLDTITSRSVADLFGFSERHARDFASNLRVASNGFLSWILHNDFDGVIAALGEHTPAFYQGYLADEAAARALNSCPHANSFKIDTTRGLVGGGGDRRGDTGIDALSTNLDKFSSEPTNDSISVVKANPKYARSKSIIWIDDAFYKIHPQTGEILF